MIQQSISLQPFNTLGLPGRADYFAEVNSLDQLNEALGHARAGHLPVTVIGGGSNLVVAGDVAGLVIHNNIRGISAVADGDHVLVTAAAGESWHQLVLHCLAQGWSGLENLSLIPGSVGAAPIQNIGAYGVELESCFVSLQAVMIDSGQPLVLNREQCQFGYRDSIFKHELKGRCVITSVTLRLATRPVVNLSYPALANALADVSAPTPQQVSAAVIQIRQSKLPDPDVLPNAGSFFKNPVVAIEQFESLKQQFPELPSYPAASGVKLPAAWLIEQCGFKGSKTASGAVGVHDKQALVLVHFGGGSGSELLAFAGQIQLEVEQRFGVVLEIEPQRVGG